MRVVRCYVVAIALLVLITACSSGGSKASAPTTTTVGIGVIAPPTTRGPRSATTSTPPTSVGATVSECETKPTNNADFVAKVHQAGQAAYQSRPINIPRIGYYVLIFGPLTPNDVVRFHQSKGGGLSFLMDQQFQPQSNWSQLKPVIVKGATYLRLSMRVSDLTEPCTGLRVWAQF